ncbi:MAG: peptidylprolyl isomerase [Gemmatimonadota bacterium]
MNRFILTAALILASGAPATAQEQTTRTDRIGHIVAVVGDSAVLNFDIQNAILAQEALQEREIPESGPEYDEAAQFALEMKINELLIIQAALRDTSIVVPEDRVLELVEEKLAEDRQQLGGEAGLEIVLSGTGLTMEAYRRRLAAQYRKESLIQQYRARIMQNRKPPPVTETELSELFEQNRAQFGRRPATINYEQVSVMTEPSDTALASARERADSVFALLLAGGDFAEIARQFTEEPGGRERGGSLGWFRRSDMVREFADAAFAMRAGTIAGPVKTPFGYHIIRVERVRGAEVNASHILLRPTITTDDALRAKARADTVAQRMREGAAAAALAEQYGASDIPVRVGPVERAAEQQRIGVDLSTVRVGDVLGPLPLGGEDVASEFRVLKVSELEAERDWSLDDAILRQRLQQEAEAVKLMEEIVADLRRSTYVDVRGF